MNSNRAKFYVTYFDIPDSYLVRTLHAEEPLTDVILKAVRKLFLHGREENARIDMRNHEEKVGTFDDFIKNFKTHKIRYAWTGKDTPERHEGGTGKNPSLDFLINGTHHGLNLLFKGWNDDSRDIFNELRSVLQDIGYVGLEYNGGVRIAGSGNRGGGGIRHKAFVLWDSEAVNKFKKIAEHGNFATLKQF